MASYQIPQFLDSGDNILGPLNLIQFGYVLGGAFISFIIYTILGATIPALGVFNLVPSALPLLFALFLAMGKFNGRNIEIYVMKFIVSKLKPQTLVFRRHAETADLDEKLARISETAIQKQWAERVVEEQLAKTGVASFNTITSEDKAQRIRNLSFTIDTSMRNTLASVKAKEIELEGTQHSINVLANIKNKNRNYSQSPLLQPTPLKQTDQKADEINFFN